MKTTGFQGVSGFFTWFERLARGLLYYIDRYREVPTSTDRNSCARVDNPSRCTRVACRPGRISFRAALGDGHNGSGPPARSCDATGN